MSARRISAKVRDSGLSPIGPPVETYPLPPGADPSKSYRVRVLGIPVFVERYADVSYARFAMRGSVTVEVEVTRSINRHAIFPEERVESPSVMGNSLKFDLVAPDHVVVFDRRSREALHPA